MAFLGLQDATRKICPPLRNHGTWDGSIVSTVSGLVTVHVLDEKWAKAKVVLAWIKNSMSSGEAIDYKTLLSHRGFLIYIVCTCPTLITFLRNIHATLDGWRPGQDEGG